MSAYPPEAQVADVLMYAIFALMALLIVVGVIEAIRKR